VTSLERKPPPPLTSDLAIALDALFNRRDSEKSSVDILSSFCCSDVVWNNPLFRTSTVQELADNIDSLRSFILDSTIEILSETEDGECTNVEWLFSFVHPLPWAPRVTISGKSSSTSTSAGTKRIEDLWSNSPWTVIRQALPRLTDAMWLWPSPHAETDIGVRRVVKRTRDYTIVSYAAHPEFRVRGDVEPFEMRTVWAMGVLPDDSFIGSLRRREPYDAVSPIGVRRISGERFEWAVSVPGSAFGKNSSNMEHPFNNASFSLVRERRLAIVRFRGFATQKYFVANRDKLLAALVRDQLLDEEDAKDESRVWSRLYQSKLGFNSKFEPTMASYGHVSWLPRVNEIAVELDDIFD